MKIGFCAKLDRLQEVEQAGFAYIEPSVTSVYEMSDETFEEARKSHQFAESSKAVLEREQQKREEELNEQIEALDRQIRELYEQWGQNGNKNDAIWRFMESKNEQDGD